MNLDFAAEELDHCSVVDGDGGFAGYGYDQKLETECCYIAAC